MRPPQIVLHHGVLSSLSHPAAVLVCRFESTNDYLDMSSVLAFSASEVVPILLGLTVVRAGVGGKVTVAVVEFDE